MRPSLTILLAVFAVALAVPALVAGTPGEAAFALTQRSDAGALPLASPSEAAAVTCEACLPQSVPALDPQAARPLSLRMPRPDFAVRAKAAALYDATCDRLVYGLNEHQPAPPASLTKMLTALVAVDLAPDPDRAVAVNVSGSYMMETTGSSVMGLEPGMQVTLRDLVYGLILPSGNDAAVALAEALAGSQAAFVDLMNARAAALGLTESRFANPHGLDDDGLYASAYDMVRLGIAMMRNPVLAEIAGAVQYAPSYGGKAMRNSNKFPLLYAGGFGVKIGFTDNAGHAIVAAAERDGRQLFVSVLGAGDFYEDAIRLLDWGFANAPRC